MSISFSRFANLRTKRVRAIVIGLLVLGVVIFCFTLIFSISEDKTDESIPLEWYTATPRIDRPRFITPQHAFAEIPNLPTAYLNPKFTRANYGMNETCALYPDVFQLSFHNLYWQSLSLGANDWYLFAAYYENRAKSDVKPAIRVLVVVEHFNETEKLFCQIWFPRLQQPVIVPINKPERVWKYRVNGMVVISLITCPIPATHTSLVPDSVSLVEQECHTAKNHLKVIYNKAKKKHDFAVCVTALNFISVDYSIRVAEWIELVHLLGADQIFMYYQYHHENVSKVLKYYEREGKIQLHRYSLPGGQPNLPIMQNLYLIDWRAYLTSQLLGLQDCLYRNMYNYEYMTTMDIDEVIMPLVESTWKDLMKTVRPHAGKHATEFCVRNYWFYDGSSYPAENYSDVPAYLHMLRHVRRTREDRTTGRSGWHPKCFRKPENVKIEGNHKPFQFFVGRTVTYWIPKGQARLQHYCDDHLKNRGINENIQSVDDTNIWRYKKALIERLLPALNTLGFLKL